MGYKCVDRGSSHCPCALMEAGQCYSCTMIREGRCSCEDATGWEGTCPYTEYVQGNRGWSYKLTCKIINKKEYSNNLIVISVEVPAGIIEKCKFPGTFMMADADGWGTPLSVLRAHCEKGETVLEFAMQPVGPKTKWLLKQDQWMMTGPFYSGLLGMKNGDCNKDALIIAKGTAVAPFMCGRNKFSGKVTIYMDGDKLSDDFIQEYVCGMEDNIECRPAVLSDEECLKRCRNLIKIAVENKDIKIWLLTSPFYVKALTEGLTLDARKQIIVPNPANMCCGEGVCGACSHTDENGITVRLCKCTDKW